MTRQPLMEDPPEPRDGTGEGAHPEAAAGNGDALGNAGELTSRLAAIFESSSDAIISETLQGQITSWNRGAQQIFGYAEQDVLGRSITIIIPPGRQDEAKEMLSRVSRGERVESYETQRITRDGRLLEIWVSLSAVRDSKGEVIGAIKVARDVTERKRHEEALQRRLAQLRILYGLTDTVVRASALEEVYDAALDGLKAALGADRASILLADEQGVMRFGASRGLSEGYRAAAEKHSPWPHDQRTFVPVFIRDAREADLGPLRETIEKEGIRALGFFPLVHQGRLLGKFMVYFSSPHDFSEEESRLGQAIAGQIAFAIEQKRSEAVLHQREEAFRALVENSPDLIARFDRQYRHLYVNPAVLRETGLQQQDFLGRSNREMGMPAELCDQWEAIYEATFSTGQEQVLEFSYQTPHGLRYYSSRVVPEFAVDGRVVSALGVTRDVTARTTAQEAIRESEERLRLATETGKVGLWDWDVEANHVTWTESLYDVHGLQRGEFEPTVEGFAALVHPEDRQRVGEALRRAMEEDAPYELEFRSPRPDGSVVWLFTNARVLRRDGVPVRMLGGTMDITRIKRAEEAARESEQRFRMLADSAPVLIWMSDPEKEGLYFNKVWLEFTGRSLEQELGEGWFASIHPEDLERAASVCAAAFAARQPFTMQFRMRRADGQWRWLHDTGAPRFEPDGTFAGYIGSCIDITDRMEAEAGLRRSEGLLRAVVDTAVDGIITIDERGTVASFNPAAERIFGYAADEVIGRNVSMLMPEPYRGEHDGYIGNYRRTGERQIIGIGREVQGLRKDGSVFPLELAVSETLVGPRQVFTGLVRDISDRKHAEEEREHLLLSERAARADAERANRLKDEFLATVSHELRTPLNAIVGWSQLLGPRSTREEVAEGLQVIDRNTHALVRLVEDLLDVSRIISGKMRLDVQRVDLAEVIEAAVRSVEPAADAKGVRLQKVLDPNAGRVTGDPARLQQVIWNLISNAIKFTPRDGRVQIVLQRVNSHVEVVVADTGEGIDPELLPHLFERFRQADSTTTRRHGGLGIGLALVRHLVELHGGSVEVKSPGKGQGATFTIALPVRAIEPDVSASPSHCDTGMQDHPHSPRPVISLEGAQVLAIDDDADTRALVRRCLEQAGATVIAAESAAAGFARLREDPPDLLLCDIGMPGEDGYSFIRRVRKLPPDQGGRTPAIALTAFARSDDRTRALLAGFQMHLPKPVEPGELLVVVANIIDRFNATSEA